MATTIDISCPECAKQIKAPATLEGKKIRCKGCGHVFVVQAAAAAGTFAVKEEPKPAPKKKPAPAARGKGKAAPAAKQPDDEDDPNPYVVTDLDTTPRCPHCAGDMEEGDVICLNCGYNLETRTRPQQVVLVEHNFLDWFLWLAPPILCVFLCLGLIGFILFLFFWLTPIIEAHKEDWWAFAPRIFQLWGTIFSLFIIFFAGKFALRRFIFHPVPPEKRKRPTRVE